MAVGNRVGYYKPYSRSADNDPDVSFISQTLLAGLESPEVPGPRPLLEDAGAEPLLSDPSAQSLKEAATQVAAATDLALVEGPDLLSPGGEPWALPLEVATLLDCRVLLLVRYSNDLDTGSMLGAIEPLRDRLAGVIINGVTNYRRRDVELGLMAGLRSGGVPALGMVPEDRAMLAVTVEQIADHLGGSWVQDPVNTDSYVERFLIGGNIMDAGPTYFGRFANQAVITRVERPDIQLASLMEDTKCLVLTGAGEPIEYIKAEALQRDVPLILVEQSTLSTAEALGGLLDRANAHSRWKIDRFSQLLSQHLDMDALEAAIT